MSIRYRFLIPPLILLLLGGPLACRTVMGAWGAFTAPSSTPSETALPATQTQTATPLPPSPTLRPTATPIPPSPTPTSSPSPSPPPPTATPTLELTATTNPLQIQVFQEVWSAVADNYVYPDFNGLDWEAVYAEYLQRIESGLSDEEFYLAIAEMIDHLGDEHSFYFNPEEAAAVDAEYEGAYDYVGIGVMSIVTPECNCITIILVFPNSPAEQAGLHAHDSILTADGQPILDENGVRRDLLRGPVGTSLQLTVQSPGESPRQVNVSRQRINGPLPAPYQALITPGGKRVGYIFIPTFSDSNIDEGVGRAIEAMSAAGQLEGLILDNRQNSGGSSDVFVNTLAYFTDGPSGYLVDRTGTQPLVVPGGSLYGSQQIPLVVMVGPGTASFGEIFAGILKDIGRAYVIGELTDGNVEILSIYDFSDGSRAWIASATFRPLNHPEQDWEQTGIIPDLTIPVNWAEVTLESDPAVQAALEHFDNP